MLLLGKSDEVLVISVHVGQLAVNQHHDLVLARLLLFPGGQEDHHWFIFAAVLAPNLFAKDCRRCVDIEKYIYW